MKGALVVEHLSRTELCEGNLEMGGGLLYWGPWRMCKGRLWRRASLSIVASLENLEGSSSTGDLKRLIKEGPRNGASLSEGIL